MVGFELFDGDSNAPVILWLKNNDHTNNRNNGICGNYDDTTNDHSGNQTYHRAYNQACYHNDREMVGIQMGYPTVWRDINPKTESESHPV